jgi:hypothetical protein
MFVMGQSTRRLGVLYDVADCEDVVCYRQDAHTTYNDEHTSHQLPLPLEELQSMLRDAAGPPILYNEVKAGRLGQVLGLALLESDVPDAAQLVLAKEVAVAFIRNVYPSSTIVVFNTTNGVLS